MTPLDLSRFFEQHPTLETERLILRQLRSDDREAIFDYASDPEVTKYMLFNRHQSIEEADVFLESVRVTSEKRERIEFAMELRSTGEFIGVCGLHHFSPQDHRAEVGYVMRRTFWGKGYMVEAVRELLRFAFEEMGMHHVYATCFEANERSARVMERCGMRYEGTMRDHQVIRGEYVTSKLYSILRHEFVK